jgi:branched-chain amino acid transport system ATP-binding protein
LQFVGLAEKAGAPAVALTIFERRRLDLARVLATGASVLLLDENMAGLSQREIEAAIALVQAIRQKGRSVIIIEHIMRAILGVADRLMVLSYGETIAQGPPAIVVVDPVVVKAYLGEGHAQSSRA